MDKLGRNYRLTVDTEDTPLSDVNTFTGSESPKEDITPPLTLEFDIQRNVLSSLNASTIRIYNLSKDHRNMLYKDQHATNIYKGVQLRAGYGDAISTIFKGNISQGWSAREGVNYITTLEALDGGFAMVNSQVAAQFKSGTPKSVILNELRKTLKGIAPGAMGNITGSIPRGNSYIGNSGEIIRDMADFYIDMETSFLLADDECIPGTLTEISSATGLLGSPKRQGTLVMVDMIFEPRLMIGQSITLISNTEDMYSSKNISTSKSALKSSTNSDYKVMSLHHRGTISDSTSSQVITTVGLWLGTQILQTVGK